MINLNGLWLYNNQIKDINPLKELYKLIDIILRDNNIIHIPEFIFRLNNWEIIVESILEGNPNHKSPPKEIIDQGKNSILQWFKAKKGSFK